MPFNNTPFLNGAQWQTMLHWLPEDLWRQVRPATAIQDDVNGVPRAGAISLLDRGIHYLFTGINEDSGGLPFPRPSAFWWKMPDGRRLFVWLNIGYGSGFDFFESAEWRRGPVPRAADATYRPPRVGDILRTDEASLRKAQAICLKNLRALERSGYRHSILIISITSQWRFDNDPPFPPLADFVAAWNHLGLEPRLRLTTVSDAMRRMEHVMGPSAPEHSGEWTDWWANGSASAPREVAASRAAKRFLSAAAAPVWGPMTPTAQRTADELTATSACSTSTPGARASAWPNRSASTRSASSTKRAGWPGARWLAPNGSWPSARGPGSCPRGTDSLWRTHPPRPSAAGSGSSPRPCVTVISRWRTHRPVCTGSCISSRASSPGADQRARTI